MLAAAFVALGVVCGAAPSAVAGDEPARSNPTGAFVAQALNAELGIYENAGDTQPERTLANPTATDGQLVLLVDKIRTDGWLKVLLPIRPNGSTGWVRAREVAMKFNPYRIVVELDDHLLKVFKKKKLVLEEPVGIGKSTTPTPGGRYYVTQLFRPGNPDGPYGPYAYALSGFSEVLTSFKGGEAIVGIHGTNRPDLVGEDVSSGCIRMQNDAIRRLAKILPLGTPVAIRE